MLYIYSGDVPALDKRLRKALGAGHIVLPIPARPSATRDATVMAACLRDQGLCARVPSARDYRDPERLRRAVMNSQAVFLLGGNTYAFLNYARAVGLFELLADFEAQGGIVASESAGSIVLSPTIATAAIPTFDADEPSEDCRDYLGMGRIPFHISPHYDPHRPSAAKDMLELRTLAHATRTPVLVLRDREGVVMEDERITHVVGQPLWLSPDDAPSARVVLPEWAVRPMRLTAAHAVV
ncbi:MAG: Type 1 glutamine amidotransferase-like domain-containing protein [Pseudomonadota bacterium]